MNARGRWRAGLAAAAAGSAIGVMLAAQWLASTQAATPNESAATIVPHHETAVEAAFAELEAVQFAGPEMATRRGLEAQREQHLAAAARVLELTDTVRRLAPHDQRTARWMGRRWSLLTHALERADQALEECTQALHDASLRNEALLSRAEAALRAGTPTAAERLAWALDAERENCDNTRVALVWCELASNWATAPHEQREWLERARRLAEHAPGASDALQRAADHAALVGTTPELLFDALANHAPVKLSELRGAPVLVLVWSGASPRVQAALLAARELHRTRASGGLHVLGAHEWRIDGGLEALQARLRELDFEVPHYYEESAAPWSSALRELGVRAVPLALLIDRSGRVSFVSRRVEALEPLLELLLTADSSTR